MVTTYHQYIGSSLWEGKHYGSGQFFSPMKDIREQTVLIEDSKENKNDSYRQRTKYDDQVDCYFSTYDLNALTGNRDSYLEGKLSSEDDVDCYQYTYKVRPFYEKMGVSSKITIRVENRNGEGADVEGTYRIQIAEERTQNKSQEQSRVQTKEQTVEENGRSYREEVDRLHDEQYRALPEEDRYQGNESVEELLKRLASGERLSKQELEYLKIYANLHDYEKAEAASRLQNKLYLEIVDRLKDAGMDLEGKSWELEINAFGKVTISGDLADKEKEQAEKILEEEFSDRLWNTYMQASGMDSERYNQISAYREISSFLQKATGGQYKWEDIYIDEDEYGNIKIAGLPDKLCRLLNSQESNGKYEQLRDDIYLLSSAQSWAAESSWTDFRVKYRSDGSEQLL